MTVLAASAVSASVLIDGMGCGPENSMTVAREVRESQCPVSPTSQSPQTGFSVISLV